MLNYFHFQCMVQYLQVLISEGSVISITCPDAQCRKQGKVLLSEVNLFDTSVV